MTTERKKLKTYEIKRTVVEYFEVEATSKKEALKQDMENPSRIDVISEKAKLKKR